MYRRSLGPREHEALRLVEQQPGLTVAELADALGVPMNRAWQIVGRLESSRVRLTR
jgi:DNA-binding IclR family transcriptional regulator